MVGLGMYDEAWWESDISFHVSGSSVGKNMYLCSGFCLCSFMVSIARAGHSLSPEPCPIADVPVQLMHLRLVFGVGHVFVRWLRVHRAQVSVVALHSVAWCP